MRERYIPVKARLLRALERAGLLGPAYRAYERLRALGARSRGGPSLATDGLPVPPPALVVRVAGTPDLKWFLESGRLAGETIRLAVEQAGRPIERMEAILDFGCGCGRVTRRWRGLKGVAVHGSDSSAEAIEWCRANLTFAEFGTNGLEPPLSYPDGAFDLVYALSVLTHLPEELGLGWRDELRRVVRPGGLLLLSTHGERYRERLTPAERDRFDGGGCVVRWGSVAGTNLCTAFHPQAYVRGVLAAGLELVDFVPDGARGNPHQDFAVFRRDA